MNPAHDLSRLRARLGDGAAIVRWPQDRLYVRVEALSAWSPAQHVDHLLRTLDLLLDRAETLEKGADPDIRPEGGPTMLGGLVLLSRWMPRGRGEAPVELLPDPRPVRHRLREALAAALERIRRLSEDADHFRRVPGTLPHPVLGSLDASRWIRLADVHTRHHLAIIADIDRRRAIGQPGTAARIDDEPETGVGAQAR